MRSVSLVLSVWLTILVLLAACVDPEALLLRGTVDVIVVEGTINNLAEAQLIRLNHSKADPATGRFGTTPLTKAQVEIIVDSSQIIPCHETVDGSYQLPADFRGQIGHAYQLRFSLSDGTRYVSSQQVMPAVPAIDQVRATFNLTSLSQATALDGFYRAGHDLFVDLQDPVDQHNYYRWDWTLYEKQEWCRSCHQGVYAVNALLPHVYRDAGYVSGDSLFEDCFIPVQTFYPGQPPLVTKPFVYDYVCRTQCWEVLHNYDINVFDDQYSNGGLILDRLVAHIPYYTHNPCLVELRQGSLTADAYQYYKLFEDQTQRTGGLADTPPTVLTFPAKTVGSANEAIVGYFTASAVAEVRYWLDRKDAIGLPLGASDPTGPSGAPGAELFYALNLRQPIPEPTFPHSYVIIWGGPSSPPTAICVSSDSRTPYKLDGWRD